MLCWSRVLGLCFVGLSVFQSKISLGLEFRVGSFTLLLSEP